MVISGQFCHFATFLDVFGHFGGILGRFWIGAFWGIASRLGPRGRRPTTPQYPPNIPISLRVGIPQSNQIEVQNAKQKVEHRKSLARFDSFRRYLYILHTETSTIMNR